MATAGLFLALTAIVWVTGVPSFERHLYEAITAAVPKAPCFRWITGLGSETVLVPAFVLLMILAPRQFRRHWWLWMTVMLVASGFEGLGKAAIGRPRPETLRAGFPSGHTASVAAFSMMACYLAEGFLKRRVAKHLLYGVGAIVIASVGLSRIALRVHWPLDVLGGAALGIAVLAGAAWWHERYPDGVSRWPNALVMALVAVLRDVRFLRLPAPSLADQHPPDRRKVAPDG